MIRRIMIDGQEMTAVVLGDSWSNDPEQYRNSLLEVVETAIMNKEMVENGIIKGECLYDCIRLARAMEQKPVLEKGGGV